MLDVFTTYYAENPGSLMQLAICVGLFAACYIVSRVVRYKVCPWPCWPGALWAPATSAR